MHTLRLVAGFFLFVAVSVVAQAQAPAGAGSARADLGNVRAGQVRATLLGIPLFRPKVAPDATFGAASFRDTIYSKVESSPAIRRSPNPALLETAIEVWHKGARKDFSGFKRASAEIACIGFYEISGTNVVCDVYVYEATSGTAIFAKQYTEPRTEPSRLAGRIADDLLRYLASEEGISNSYVAFVSDRSGYKEVWVMQADGTNPMQLTNERSLISAPAWGARGGEIYFTSYRQYNPDLYGILLDRSKSWVISSLPGGNLSASWSEASQKMALVLVKDGNSEIYVSDRSGQQRARLTRHRAIDASPTWSPDGSRIAFTSNRAGGPQIFVMDASGANVRRVTFQGSYNTEPAWSPDGRLIAYTGRAGGAHHIFVLDAQSGQARQLTSGGGNNEDPSWAPNGQYIVFASTRAGRPQIFRMRADGSQVVQLTREGSNTSAAWGPALK